MNLQEQLKQAEQVAKEKFDDYQKAQKEVYSLKEKINNERGFVVGREFEFEGKRGQIAEVCSNVLFVQYFKKDLTLGVLKKIRYWNFDSIKLI